MYHFFKQINAFFDNFISFWIGEKCYFCGEPGKFICDICILKLPFLEGNTCIKCLTPLQGANLNNNLLCGECLKNPPDFKQVYAPFWYEGRLKDLIQDVKFRQRYYYIPKIFVPIKEKVINFFKTLDLRKSFIVPVPLSKARKILRGYNQSHLIANELSKIVKIPVLYNYLIKVKEIKPMMTLSREERFKNIKGAFSVAKKNSVDTIILVDDIITTTATIREASYVLKKGGCNEIYIFGLCRAKN